MEGKAGWLALGGTRKKKSISLWFSTLMRWVLPGMRIHSLRLNLNKTKRIVAEETKDIAK